MRELKFRIWDGKKYDDHDWHINTKGNLCAWDHSGCEPLDDNYPIIIEQYTGLKDKTGKEIYESDIVKDKGQILVVPEIFECGYRHGEYSEYHEECEIIGNIHENPDLLEKI